MPCQLAALKATRWSPPRGLAKELLSRLPLTFESNKGQADPDVKFFSRGNAHALALTSSDVILSLIQPAGVEGSLEDGFNPDPAPGHRHDTGPFRIGRIRMKLMGSEAKPIVSGKDPLPGQSHYFVGHDPAHWRTGIRHFAKVELCQVYPGVNLVFYGNQQQLEFDFVVAAGAGPSSIVLGFEGTDSIRREANGSLVLNSGDGEVVLHKPNVLQEINGRQIPDSGEYDLVGPDCVRFVLGEFDVRHALVIDPVLSFSTFVGGGCCRCGDG